MPRLLSLVSVLALVLSSSFAATATAKGDSYSGSSSYWREVERYGHEGCRIVDRFAPPSLQRGLCVAQVDREVSCGSDSSLVHSAMDFAAAPKRGLGCDALVPHREFAVMSFVRSWENAPAILSAAQRLLERLPREFKRHGLTADEANALREAGISALQGIDFDIGETFGSDTLRLTFVVDACSCTIVLLMDKDRPRRHAWALLVE